MKDRIGKIGLIIDRIFVQTDGSCFGLPLAWFMGQLLPAITDEDKKDEGWKAYYMPSTPWFTC
jgi:hypothetical protein